MVGTFENASLAAASYYGGLSAHVFSMDGSTRAVYLIEDVIYKVPYHGFNEANTAEYDNITNTRAMLPEGLYYPNVSLFDVQGTPVIAMDRIKGQLIYACNCMDDDEECDEFCMTDKVKDIVSPFLGDTGGMNVILNDEGVWIIDAC